MIYTDPEGFFLNHPQAFLSKGRTRRWAFPNPDQQDLNTYCLDYKAGWNRRDGMPIQCSENDAVRWVESGIVPTRKITDSDEWPYEIIKAPCDECGEEIPDHLELINKHHKTSCSLHPEALV